MRLYGQMALEQSPPEEVKLARRTQFLIRNTAGTSAVEWFVIWAVTTILLTRAYLQLTGYPQIGSGDLHIAHALWGGALMLIALVVGWSFLGSGAHGTAIFLGGVGFGLFLDEVGKFVTKTNDYFFRPSAEIMFIIVVALLLVAGLLRDLKKPTAVESLANASAIAAEGVTHGLTARRRDAARAYLQVASNGGSDPAVIEHVEGLLSEGWENPDRLMAVRKWFKARIPGFFRSTRLLTFCGWLLVVFSALELTQLLGEHWLDPVAHPGFPKIMLTISAITLLASTIGMVYRKRTTHPWPLRILRAASLVFTMATAFVNFANQGFGALAALAVGLFIFAVINFHEEQRATAYLGTSSAQDETATPS